MDPNPYDVSEPELLRGLRFSWRGGLLPDRPGFSVVFHEISHRHRVLANRLKLALIETIQSLRQ
jgi:hypothetical protein